MKFLTTILFSVLLAGCSSGDEMINVDIIDWAAGERMEKAFHKDRFASWPDISDYTKRGVVKVSEVDWEKNIDGTWSGRKKKDDGVEGGVREDRTYCTVDAEGAKAVSDYID